MRIAAIDVGTNSIHMIVCRIRPDLSFEVVDREKDMIRLGAGGLEGRRLTETSMAVAMHTLSKFKRLAESHAVDEIIAAATSAVREATNGAEFIASVHRDIDIRVKVISGAEEARLIHHAALYASGAGPKRAVVIDIGGGSTEITSGTLSRMQMGRSFKLGAIRLTEKFVRTDPLSGRDERKLMRFIRREAGPFLKQLSRRGFDRVIGTSGTILTIGALAAGRPGAADLRNLRVELDDIRRLRKTLVARSLKERLAIPGLDPRRADLAVAGVVLVVPGETIFFRADPSGIAYLGKPASRAADTVNESDWAPLTCIYGVEEKDSLCPKLKVPGATVIAMPGGHNLRHDAQGLLNHVLAAVARSERR